MQAFDLESMSCFKHVQPFYYITYNNKILIKVITIHHHLPVNTFSDFSENISVLPILQHPV